MSESYADVPVALVKSLGYAYLARRIDRIHATRTEIVEHLYRSRWYWLFPWVPKAKRTRDLVHQQLRDGDRWHEYHMCELEGGLWASMVKEVLSQASAPGVTHITMSSRLFQVMSG